MHLVEIFLPLFDNQGRPLPRELFEKVRRELVDRFGGLTAFARSPAEGLWEEEEGGQVTRDDIVIFEVMADQLYPDWWSVYRQELEEAFRQEEIIVRASVVQRL